MPRRPSVTQADICRTLKGALAAGLAPHELRLEVNYHLGTIRVQTVRPGGAEAPVEDAPEAQEAEDTTNHFDQFLG